VKGRSLPRSCGVHSNRTRLNIKITSWYIRPDPIFHRNNPQATFNPTQPTHIISLAPFPPQHARTCLLPLSLLTIRTAVPSYISTHHLTLQTYATEPTVKIPSFIAFSTCNFLTLLKVLVLSSCTLAINDSAYEHPLSTLGPKETHYDWTKDCRAIYGRLPRVALEVSDGGNRNAELLFEWSCEHAKLQVSDQFEVVQNYTGRVESHASRSGVSFAKTYSRTSTTRERVD
jgi:hypothetical protein